MKIYPTLYWVEYWDEFEGGCGEMRKASGCTFASTFTEATKHIEDYYGEDLCSVKLEMLEECECLEFANYEEAEHIEKIGY